jgi:hypothetical protein
MYGMASMQRMRVSVQQEKKQRSNEKFKTAKKSLIKMP